MDVIVKRVQLEERPDASLPGYVRTGRYTDILIERDGVFSYSRVPGWDTALDEGFHRAAFEQRQRGGFYRVNG